ncbi:hypothetical protein BDV24DRAFT_138606 [Aspergillus arachidicola]|uniref:Uncharacterized protein n=1 Tax=Aspergillus arachidicola TaxID=656916 RepID=A0A5N6Y364_9EURO|nr:hypothetical protein BDV24DRAFT_138606 [Aspergillus arachidicola]
MPSHMCGINHITRVFTRSCCSDAHLCGNTLSRPSLVELSDLHGTTQDIESDVDLCPKMKSCPEVRAGHYVDA